MAEWSEETCLKLIELYRENEVLWKTTHKDYMKKNRREDGWRKIAEEMSKPSDQCKTKMDNLKASWRREYKKVVKTTTGQGANEVYVSRWYAFKALEFLSDINKPRTTINSESPSIISATYEDTDSENVDDPGSIEDDNLMSQDSFITPNVAVRPNSSKKMKVNEHSALITGAYDMLKTATEKLNTSPSPNDEIASFFNYVTAKVRNYPPQTQTSLQHAIYDLLMKADSKYYEWSDIHNQYGYQPNIPMYSQSFTSSAVHRPLVRSIPRVSSSPSTSSFSSLSTTPSPGLNECTDV